ncbi:uncharacterized protein N7482_010313 [Penicillium canariense]|uniref:DUF7580 domain-containing protein n=1 Tax=Penicillium canariense TaxID=189055 RepID=A0A9W9HK98_9EURO|nr:uncharacterized protein N7482_010313 [Penicillium canariense]KAJ5151061.1 hypothetical protein N7482_010313 [Penicillium canariense]
MEFIVGTVLAGVPIVLEAYEYYWKISDGFSNFRHYSRELIKLDTIMKTQKTLFRGNIVKLLTALTKDQDLARDLLSDASKERWATIQLHGSHNPNRLESLRDAFSSWEATMKLVLDSITTVCGELEGFRTSHTAQGGVSAGTTILRQLPRRFRLCWKKENVQSAIKELRDFTADFNELTARIVAELRDIQSTAQRQELAPQWKASCMNSLEKYRQVRSASYILYNIFALRWCCAQHDKHAANISLVDDRKFAESDRVDDYVKFNVAIDCAASSPLWRETLIWLEIEALNGNHQGVSRKRVERSDSGTEQDEDNIWADKMEGLAAYSRPIVIRPAKKAQRKVLKKASQSVPTPAGAGGLMSTIHQTDDDSLRESIPDTPDSMVDLETIEDFCGHFQIGQSRLSTSCVGYIKELNLHRFYLPSAGQHVPEQQKSLEEIITWVSEDEFSRNLPRTTIVHLACSLATAVLQYHSTPWLPDTWKSSQVRFFGIGELSEYTNDISSTIPYFRVEFSKPEKSEAQILATATGPNTENTRSSASIVVARNELLFRFGTVLLELGYSKPWLQLQRWALQNLPLHKQADYHAAEKLAQAPMLRNRMGPRFTTIVRKCLGCDFGLGENDLANEQLQGVFLVDVIGALKEVEHGLKDLEKKLGGY